METHSLVVVVIPCSFTNARKVCELIQNQKFANSNELKETLQEKEIETENVLWYKISDFMDEVNNGDLDTFTDSFISYVWIQKK
jgi:hypothetical protein